jgi:hypothetical protein
MGDKVVEVLSTPSTVVEIVVAGPQGPSSPGGGGAAIWGGIGGNLADQTDLQGALNGKQPAGSYASAAQGEKADSALQPGAQIPWTDITGKPALFSGAYADLTGKPDLFSGAFGDLTGVPAAFPPAAHSHAIGDVSGLQSALDGKAPIGGAIAYADAALQADVELTANNTWYSGPSITLPAGTWFVMSTAHYRRNATTAAGVVTRVWNGVMAVANGGASHPSLNGAELQIPASGPVVLTAQTTLTLQMLATTGGAGISFMKAQTQSSPQGNLPTRISAIRLA